MKVLTGEAKRTMANLLLHGLHVGKPDACEPPYMLPSEDPDHYSAVCNLLTDASAPSDHFPFTSGAPSVGTLQPFFCFVYPAGLGYVSGLGTRQGVLGMGREDDECRLHLLLCLLHPEALV